MRRALPVFLALALLPTLSLRVGNSKASAASKQKHRPQRNARDRALMAFIPGGEFMMGSDAAEIDRQMALFRYQSDWKRHALDEIPRHHQSVKSFLLYQYEVTNEQYRQFMDATGRPAPAYWKGNTYPESKARHPVVEVSWEDAQAYCRWAGVRLPTEAEWEYAARGPSETPGAPGRIFPWGSEWDRSRANSASYHAGQDILNVPMYRAWYDGPARASFPLTTPVGSFKNGRSPFGIDDMAGNAWEWCEDRHEPYPGDPGSYKEFNSTNRIARGGSWANVSFHLRCADRNGFAPTTRNLYIGFRCARDR